MEFNYEKLDVTKLAREVTREVYILTKKFPSTEIYGLISQIRRSAVSILLNIAEGANRNSKLDNNHFINISVASLVETDCALKIAIDLGFLKKEAYDLLEPKIKELYFKLKGLGKYLKK